MALDTVPSKSGRMTLSVQVSSSTRWFCLQRVRPLISNSKDRPSPLFTFKCIFLLLRDNFAYSSTSFEILDAANSNVLFGQFPEFVNSVGFMNVFEISAIMGR